MKNFLSSVLIVVLASFLVGVSIRSADTDTVSATVTAQNISVSVADGDIHFGVVQVNDTQDSTAGGVDETQTATNDGNVTEDFNIMGSDTANWELADILASNGEDAFRLRFSLDGGTGWTQFEDDDYTALTTDIPATGSDSDTFDVEIQTPSSTTHYDEQTSTITIQAVLAT